VQNISNLWHLFLAIGPYSVIISSHPPPAGILASLKHWSNKYCVTERRNWRMVFNLPRFFADDHMRHWTDYLKLIVMLSYLWTLNHYLQRKIKTIIKVIIATTTTCMSLLLINGFVGLHVMHVASTLTFLTCTNDCCPFPLVVITFVKSGCSDRCCVENVWFLVQAWASPTLVGYARKTTARTDHPYKSS